MIAVRLPISLASQERPTYRLAFASFGPIDTDFYVADGDGNNARPFLPDPGLDYNASLSSDGR